MQFFFEYITQHGDIQMESNKYNRKSQVSQFQKKNNDNYSNGDNCDGGNNSNDDENPNNDDNDNIL